MKVVCYQFPIVGNSADSVRIVPTSTVDRIRKTRNFLAAHKRKDCKKQLAVFAVVDGEKQLYGYVNMYNNCSYWHDVTVGFKAGRPEKLIGITEKLPLCVMRDKTGIIDEDVHIYATRF